MKIIGTVKNVKAFLKDIPVVPGEKMTTFIATFRDCSILREIAHLLYNVEISFADEKSTVN